MVGQLDAIPFSTQESKVYQFSYDNKEGTHGYVQQRITLHMQSAPDSL